MTPQYSRDYRIFIGQMHNPRSLKDSLFEGQDCPLVINDCLLTSISFIYHITWFERDHVAEWLKLIINFMTP